MQDPTCQQILEDSNRWINVADKIKEDWKRCLEELLNLEKLLEEDKKTRVIWSKRLKFAGWALGIILSLITGINALYPLSKFTLPSYVPQILNIISLLLSLSTLSQLNARAHEYLTLAKDSEKLNQMCKNIRMKLKEVIKDGRITETERALIRDMMGEMHKRSEEIGSLDLLMNILGNGDSDSSSFKFFSPDNSNYKTSFDGINSILQDIKISQKEMTSKIPQIIREYRDMQLQGQIHSGANPMIPQRLPSIIGEPAQAHVQTQVSIRPISTKDIQI